MASAIKKVQAVLEKEFSIFSEPILKISYETIYLGWPQFEIKNDDVEKRKNLKEISFEFCFMMKIPAADSLFNIAPNLKHLELRQTNLTQIRSRDLQGFERLTRLYIVDSEIEELPSDLFIHTPNLKHISFISNKIKIIGENILEPLKNLKSFDLSGNIGIDVYYNERWGGDGWPTLVQFKEAIKRCKSAQIKELENLKRKFEAQEEEMIDLKKLCLEQGAKIEGQKKVMDDIKKHCDALKKEFEKKLEKAKQDGAFLKFDFTIKINGKSFKVQKEILAANSPVLANLIRDNEDADELELKDISEEAFGEILNFMVKKIQPKPTSNFIEIYAASGRLQMKELMDLCARTLIGKVAQENALKVLNLCEKYPNKELEKKAFDEMKKIYDKP